MSEAPIEVFAVSGWPEYVQQLLRIPASDVTRRRRFPVYWTSGASLPSWLPVVAPPVGSPPSDERSRDAGSLVALVYDAASAASAVSEPDHLVVACGDADLAVVAAFLAGATGRRFERIEDPGRLPDLARRPALRSVLVVCSAALAEHPWLSEPALEARPPLGLIPARTAAEASLAACKTLAATRHPGRGRLRINCLSASTAAVHRVTEVWTRQQLDAAAVESLTTARSPRQLLLLDAHGHGDRLYLGDATLWADGTEPDFGQLRAGVVFANTCAGAQLAPGGPDPCRRLAQRAVAGWPYAYVSTLTVKDNSTIESELFEALLLAGRPLGEAVRTVNAYLRDGGVDLPAYVLLGDPLTALPGRRPTPAAHVEWRAGGDGAMEARVPLAGPGPVEIRLPEAPAAGWRLVPAPGESGRAIRCAILQGREAGVASALLWSGPREASVGLRLAEGPARPPLGDLPGRLAALSACGVNLQPVRGPVTQLENEIRRMARLAGRAEHDLDAARELDERRRGGERLLASVQETLVEACCQRLLSGSLQFTERYRDPFRVAEVARSSLPCACGLRLSRKLLCHRADPEIRRAAHVCPACGVVADGPADLEPARLLLPAGARGPGAPIVLRWTAPPRSSVRLTAGVVGCGHEAGPRPWRAAPDVADAQVSGDVEVAFHGPAGGPAVADGRLVGFALVDLRLLFFARSTTGGGAG